VNWPGHIPAGKTVDEPLHAVDWYPTLVKLTGATIEQKLPLDGLDIWPVLTEGAKSPHDALILCGTKRGQAAIRMGDWKLLVGAGNGDQLYNLAKDLGEKNNLASANPEKLKELRARYDDMMSSAVPCGAPVEPGSKKKKKRK
jgi:arylsulfatase A-like enzyme